MPSVLRRLLRPESWPLLIKICIDLMLIALVPLGVAMWLTTSRTRAELEGAARQNLQQLARATASRIDQLIIDTSRMTQQIALDQAIVDALTEPQRREQVLPAAQRRLNAVIATNPDYFSTYVLDSGGTSIITTNPKNLGMNWSFREYYGEAMAGRNYVSDVMIGKTDQAPGIYFSSPIHRTGADDVGSILGVLVLKLRAEKLWEIVDGVRVGADGYAMLTDTEGIVVSHPNRELLYHSFAPLAPSRIGSINPMARYNRQTIPSLDMPELQPRVDDQSVAGNVAFTLAGRSPGEPRAEWVAGYARLKERPWKVVVVQSAEQFNASVLSVVHQQGLIALAVAGAAALLALWRAHTVVRPVLSITRAARQLARGDFDARAVQYSDDEVGQLAETFNEMVPRLHASVELQQSITLAKEVQQALLPQKPPTLHRLDVVGQTRYCDSTGGDYFDFADILDWPDRNALIAVGDVTGHGIPAALVMCTARAALRAAALTGGSLGRLLTCVNTILTQDLEHNLYMTMTLMVIDPDRGIVRYACAGHDPIIAYNPATDTFGELKEGSVPLGAMADAKYAEYSAGGLTPGTVLLLGTDGIWEARNDRDELFGKERLQSALRGAAGASATDIAAQINRALDAFLNGKPIQDDVTFVVAKVL